MSLQQAGRRTASRSSRTGNRYPSSFYPKSHSGSVAEPLFIIDRNSELGRPSKSVAQSGSSLQRSPFRRAIESSDRRTFGVCLNNHRFWETANCILVKIGEDRDPLDTANSSDFPITQFADLLNSSIVIHKLQHLGSRWARVMRLTSIASGASQARKDW